MKKMRLKQISFVMVLLFGFNVLASLVIGALARFSPEAYKINTSTFSQFVNYWIKNGWSYGVVFLGYLMIYFILVLLLIVMTLICNQQFSFSRMIRGIKTPAVYVMTLGLILIFWPLNALGLKFPVTNYITIPQTFVSMVSNPLLWIIFWGVILIVILLFFRLKRVLFDSVTSDQKVRHPFKESWKKTTGKFLSDFFQLFQCAVQFVGATGIVFALQWLVDRLGVRTLSISFANVMIALLAGVLYFITAEMVFIFLSPLEREKRDQKYSGITALVMIVLIGFVSLILSGKMLHTPNSEYLVMAHMGIASKEDVPNSILSLKKAHEAKPDYVEIDIQKTKDGTFVLSHDTSIESLSGKKYVLNDVSWNELKQVEFKSGNQTVKLTRFDDYIKKANQLKQKILIELKINATITNQELEAFEERYGALMEENHAQIQSLNQNALARLSKYSENGLGLLSPVDNAINASKFNTFYAIEYSSLSPKTVAAAKKVNKSVYAWTVDTQADLSTTYAYGVKGFITDQPARTRKTLDRLRRHPHYDLVVWNALLFKRANF